MKSTLHISTWEHIGQIVQGGIWPTLCGTVVDTSDHARRDEAFIFHDDAVTLEAYLGKARDMCDKTCTACKKRLPLYELARTELE